MFLPRWLKSSCKSSALAYALVTLGLAYAARAQAAGSPALPVQVIVKGSFLVRTCGGTANGNTDCASTLHLKAEVAGVQMELEEAGTPQMKRARSALLAPGYYKAEIAKDDSKTSYLIDMAYDLLLPDGQKQHFVVVGWFGE